MIRQDFTIDKYDWKVRIYYAMSFYPIEDIVKDLVLLKCDKEDMDHCIEVMENFEYDTGSMHSNLFQKRSVGIIGPSSSAEEFENTITHEIGHLAAHISIAYNIDPLGEEIQYIAGCISQKMFKVTEMFLCSHCREQLYE